MNYLSLRPRPLLIAKRSGRKPSALVRLVIIAGVVAAGVERIDFFGGAGPFALIPFIILAPLVILVSLVHKADHGSDLKPNHTRFGGWVLLMVTFLILFSLFFTETTRSVSRYMLLILLVAGGWALITLVRRSGDYAALRIGAALGLLAYVGFDIVQWGLFQSFGLGGPNFGGIVNLKVSSYGDGVVRLAGGSLDPNRAAVTIATYTYILIGDPVVSRTRGVLTASIVLFLGAALALATISRSGIVVFGCVLVGAVVAIWRRQSGLQKLGLAIAIATAIGWASQTTLTQTLNVQGIAESRLSLESEGSAGMHFHLLDKGWGVMDSHPMSFFTGNGYGSSFLYLQDVFPGHEYANFHSMYLTLLVEAGVFAVVLMMMLLVPPAFGSRKWLAIGVIFFGVFYQGMSDPIFWIQIAMFWVLPARVSTTPAEFAEPGKSNFRAIRP